MSKENKNSFNAGSNSMFNVTPVIDIEIDVVIHVKMMRHVGEKMRGGDDSLVDAVTFCWCVEVVIAKRMTPLELV